MAPPPFRLAFIGTDIEGAAAYSRCARSSSADVYQSAMEIRHSQDADNRNGLWHMTRGRRTGRVLRLAWISFAKTWRAL